MNVIKYKWLFLGFSSILVAASIVGLVVFGLQRGIDFTGGTLWQVKFAGVDPTVQDIQSLLVNKFGVEGVVITESVSDQSFNIRLPETSEEKHQSYAEEMKKSIGVFDELSFQTIGSVIGSELVTKALWAFFINLFGISLYVAYAFRKVSYPVSSWKYSIITLLTLFHDGIIPAGLFAFLGYFMGLEIDTNFIIAILVVIGFSVHDTIVVFDRIRENLRKGSGSEGFDQLVNRSINETFARSVNTSLTLIIVLVTLFILGAPSLKFFVLTILVGTVMGTYSSIFVASPLLTLWKPKGSK